MGQGESATESRRGTATESKREAGPECESARLSTWSQNPMCDLPSLWPLAPGLRHLEQSPATSRQLPARWTRRSPQRRSARLGRANWSHRWIGAPHLPPSSRTRSAAKRCQRSLSRPSRLQRPAPPRMRRRAARRARGVDGGHDLTGGCGGASTSPRGCRMPRQQPRPASRRRARRPCPPAPSAAEPPSVVGHSGPSQGASQRSGGRQWAAGSGPAACASGRA